MKVLRSAAVTAAVLLATPALADPPPLPVAVTFLPEEEPANPMPDADAFLQALIADNWFADTPSALMGEVTPCLGFLGFEACGVMAVAKLKDRRPPEVLVLTLALPDGRTRLTCWGGTAPSSGIAPSVEVNLAHPSVQERTAAAQCIISAAAAGGW